LVLDDGRPISEESTSGGDKTAEHVPTQTQVGAALSATLQNPLLAPLENALPPPRQFQAR
jgi:hypothetical protein